MAQVVKLKRTSVEGKVPSTSNLELGELAINTHDGRIFFEKDNGTPSVQQVVTTNSQTTGSINVQGNVTASYFFGDGSGLTNLPAADVSQVATVTSSFDNQSSISVTHNFGSKNIIVSVYGTDDTQIIPSSVTLTNNNSINVGLSANHSGYIVVAKGGHIVSGSAADASALNGELGSYYLDYNNFTNIPSELVSSSQQIQNYNIFATTGSNTFNGTQIVSGSVETTGDILPSVDNTGVIGNATYTWANGQFTNLTVDSTLTVTSTLNVRSAIDLADSDQLRFGSSDDFKMYYDGVANEMEFEMEATCNQIRIHDNGTTRFTFERSTGLFSATSISGSNGITGSIAATNGVISGSSQITDLTTFKEDVSGSSTYTITHNLNEEYPIVQAWNTSSKRQELPSIVESTSVNALDITFAGTFAGRIIVKK